MKRSNKWALGMIASLGLASGMALAQSHGMGPGMMHGMGMMRGMGLMHGMDHGEAAGGHRPMAGAVNMLTRQDEGSSADMDLVHEMLMNHTRIKRTVTNLPNGIKTVTESDDPQVAQSIKAHVASMSQRLKDGREIGRASCREECCTVCRSRWSPYH